ncbi:hypothetical protein BBP40_005817 [Aspergillus hancockii]|nr:hypothetical protein BBP40_005817 [Aspergillus hancockii]
MSSDCERVQRERDSARQLITPVLQKRYQLKRQAQAEDKPLPSFNDAIDWAATESNGHPYDPALLQLVLSASAIHTTSDLLAHTLILLSVDPPLVEALRAEITDVLRVYGWKKTALVNLKLLDSALKEAQRVKPSEMLILRRFATQNLALEDGVTIRKGERCCVDAYNMINPDIYEYPEKYDAYRFLRMREQPSTENKAHLVATSADHLSFGHGLHACPGRFFSANEVKVALCHLILKYDWKLAPGSTVNPVILGTSRSVDPMTRVVFRRRKEEINLTSLEFD